MSEPVWYRSLYWRIAFGFVALLAVLLVAQGVVFLWLTDRIVGLVARRTARRQLAAAAARAPNCRRRARGGQSRRCRARRTFVRDRFAAVCRRVRDRAARRRSARSNAADAALPVRMRRRVGAAAAAADPSGIAARADRPRRPAVSGPRYAPVVVARRPRASDGIVAGHRRDPPAGVRHAAARAAAPTLAWFALGLLGVGTALTALRDLPAHAQPAARARAGGARARRGTHRRARRRSRRRRGQLARAHVQPHGHDLEQRARRRSAQSDRARRQLLADVSHELMTPLTAIRGYVETLGMPRPPARRGDARPLSGDRRRGDAEARSDHRRPARPGEARRGRRDARGRAGLGRRSVRARRRSPRAVDP